MEKPYRYQGIMMRMLRENKREKADLQRNLDALHEQAALTKEVP